MKLLVEQCTSISISDLQKEIRRTIDQDNPGATEEEIYKITADELNKFRVKNQSFKFFAMNNRLGGHRWFFVCGDCDRKAQKLFLPPEEDTEHSHKFSCKTCHGLVNESVMKANNNIYKKVVRPLQQLRKIEAKLEKGHLTSEKVQQLLDEYDVIEQEMKNTPEYRHYVFKKKRGMKIYNA